MNPRRPNIALQPTSPASPSPRLSFGTLGRRKRFGRRRGRVWRHRTFLVATVFGLAAWSVPPDAVDNAQRTRVASCETASLAGALLRWSRRHEPGSEYLHSHVLGPFPFTAATLVSPADVRRRIVSKNSSFNTRDPWGNPYQVLRNHDKRQHWSFVVRTAGPDGKFCSESYTTELTTLSCDDVLRIDGVLMVGPECDVSY
jgi:hypothetical protein